MNSHKALDPSAARQDLRPFSHQAFASPPASSCSPAAERPELQISNSKEDRAAAILHVQLSLRAAASQDAQVLCTSDAPLAGAAVSAAFPASINPSDSGMADTRQGQQSNATIQQGCGQPSYGNLHTATQSQLSLKDLPGWQAESVHDQGAAMQAAGLDLSMAASHHPGTQAQAICGQHAHPGSTQALGTLAAARSCFNAEPSCSCCGSSTAFAPSTSQGTSSAQLHTQEADAAEGPPAAAMVGFEAGPPKLAQRRKHPDKAQLRRNRAIAVNRFKASNMVR